VSRLLTVRDCDTPPFLVNREALQQSLEIALLLKTNIVGEFHITRKQYLDGSIPTGFQRTGIIGIEGEIPLANKKVRIIQLSVEEDACREVSDIGHNRVYVTDRLGMPLIETVTYPDMETPDEASEAGQYLRFLSRSSGKVRTGIGAAREDVNVSISGSTRVEIKGIAHIKWIPELTHNEAYRQKALLEIKNILNKRVVDPSKWKITSQILTSKQFKLKNLAIENNHMTGYQIVAVNLPKFKGILTFFTQPNQAFAREISDRLKVVACIEKPNMTHSESFDPILTETEFKTIQKILKSDIQDGQIIFWGPKADIKTALETIEERCRLAFLGVPNETRKGLPDGTTIFERVLPGPDRMYPDTDSAPIPIREDMIDQARKNLPSDISKRLKQMKKWKIPDDTFTYILKRDLYPLIEKNVKKFNIEPSFVGKVLGQWMKNVEGQFCPSSPFEYSKIYDLFSFIHNRNLKKEIIQKMLPIIYQHPNMDFDSVLIEMEYKKISEKEIRSHIPILRKKFNEIRISQNHQAETDWIMGELRPLALGNMDLTELKILVENRGSND